MKYNNYERSSHVSVEIHSKGSFITGDMNRDGFTQGQPRGLHTGVGADGRCFDHAQQPHSWTGTGIHRVQPLRAVPLGILLPQRERERVRNYRSRKRKAEVLQADSPTTVTATVLTPIAAHYCSTAE